MSALFLFANYQFFLFKAIALGLATVLTIPKEDYRRLFPYGILFGALGDALIVLILRLLGLVRYANMGPYSILGLVSFWTPLAWGFAFMLFLWFIPALRVLLYPYLAGWVWLAYALGWLLNNLGLFYFVRSWPYWSPLLFLAWYAASAWYYLKSERIKLK